jgi:hypothetical protein
MKLLRKTIRKIILENATLDSLNPTGGIFVDHDTPAQMRATAPLGPNMTTLDKTAGMDPEDPIVIHRGIPQGVYPEIVPGDYIVIDPQLARDYAGTGEVVSLEVKMGDVLDDVTEPMGGEYLYRPDAYLELADK